MAVRVMFFTKGSLSYGDSEGAKYKNLTKKIILPSLGLVYCDRVFFECGKEWYQFKQVPMVSKW